MKTFIIFLNKVFKKYGIKLLVFCFWLLIWEIAGRIIKQELFLPSPKSVIFSIIDLSKSRDFWISIANSFIRIIYGFFLGLITGTILAILSYKSRVIYELIWPLMKIIKSTPVASFIILALVWISAKNLSVLISFLMVMPIGFSNLLHGLQSTDKKLIEMAKVFRLSRWKQIRSIYFPSILPFLISAISLGLGFSFKSGIAAEVIGRPQRSIGLNLYEAKLYLMIKELFAWTIVIITISILFEWLVMRILSRFPFNKNEKDKT
ncbi:ABC transporter permease [Herbinix luporum]|uniref:Putative membrane protein n=2 Tax=Herbinix luporum TaxID=1679721 RepID=A0A0K8J8B3_9FIRM|nr:ABC transporter permease subunit [Herbinix luporum]MDI9488346.1 ABC transporter permease subunit [Bacillota bacterium]CUH93876.1 putative membrane protein [Herbinix luporum]